jgi:hypothetical protein
MVHQLEVVARMNVRQPGMLWISERVYSGAASHCMQKSTTLDTKCENE